MIQKTQDGSSTVVSSIFGETYHSIFGAKQESMHVFIDMGLRYVLAKGELLEPIRIFEMGLGTGLNAWLTYQVLKENHPSQAAFYCGIEAYPLGEEVYKQLAYADNEAEEAVFLSLHEGAWNQPFSLDTNFEILKLWHKLEGVDSSATVNCVRCLEGGEASAKHRAIASPEGTDPAKQGHAQVLMPQNYFDLMYYDAFAPSTQAELWELKPMQVLFDALKPGGVLVTYCAKGAFRRTLQAAGFSVERISGPPRKREMLRATKPKN